MKVRHRVLLAGLVLISAGAVVIAVVLQNTQATKEVVSRAVTTAGQKEAASPTIVASSEEKAWNAKYDKYGLATASMDVIEQFAVRYMQDSHEIVGEPQILMGRRVAKQDVWNLGLGCMGDFGTIEEPPMALVIVKGELAASRSQPTPIGADTTYYIASVFELWAGVPTYVLTSQDGSKFAIALQDKTLPAGSSMLDGICPTPVPHKKTLHYGDTSPGFTSPPPLPPDIQASETQVASAPLTSLTPLPPYPTYTVVPPPLQTVVYPTLPPAP